MSSTKTSARIATPSSRKRGRFTAPVILSAALGCRAMPSAAAAANRPMPSPAPITTIPSPIAAPSRCTTFIPLSSVCVSLVMCVNGHADEDGREQCEHVRLNQNDDDLEPGDADGERHRQDDANADAG